MKTHDSDLRPEWSGNASQMRDIWVLGHLTWDQKTRRGVMRRGEKWWVRFPGRAVVTETEREQHYKTFLGSIEKSLHSPKFTVWFSAENCTVCMYKLGRTLVLFYTFWDAFLYSLSDLFIFFQVLCPIGSFPWYSRLVLVLLGAPMESVLHWSINVLSVSLWICEARI